MRKIAAHLLVGIDYLHRFCGIIHTDLKPENVLVTVQPLPPPLPSEPKTWAAAKITDIDEAALAAMDPAERKKFKLKCEVMRHIS